jgi:SAM-dependent methyltransferase
MSGSVYQFKADPYSSHSVILSRLGLGRGRRALDVGAADGFLAERLTAQGWVVTAIERDREQAARVRGRCHDVIVMDLERDQPQLDGPYHAVVYGDVLEHLRDPLATLTSLDRALAPNGLAVISVPNVAHLWIRLSLLLGHFDYTSRGILDRTHLRFYTRRSFLALLASAGLRVSELAATPVPLPLLVPERLQGPWLSAVHRLSASAARVWKTGLAYQFVAVCHRSSPPVDNGAGPASMAGRPGRREET